MNMFSWVQLLNLVNKLIFMRVSQYRMNGIGTSLTPNLFKGQYSINGLNYLMPKINSNDQALRLGVEKITKNNNKRSRKHRLAQQRSTQIEKSNRMLYEKIRKIMAKGHKSQMKLQNEHQQGLLQLNYSKPLSLPMVHNDNGKLSFNRKTQLGSILTQRSTYVEKYFKELEAVRQKMRGKPEQLGKFQTNGWKITVLLLNSRQFIILRGKKGKKQLNKKYIYHKVQSKIEDITLQKWVASKFQFQI